MTEERLACFRARRAKEIAERRRIAKKLQRRRQEKVAAMVEVQKDRQEEILREHEAKEAALERFRERKKVNAKERAIRVRFGEEQHRVNLRRLRARQRDAANALALETEGKKRRGEAVQAALDESARKCRTMNEETMLLREKLREELKRVGDNVDVESFISL